MTKTQKITYWVVTIWLALGMLSTGIVQLINMKDEVEAFSHLGYPDYLLTVLGVWKILGVIAILLPRLPLIKEWAYAGFFFVASGAIISHIALGDAVTDVLPSLLLLFLTIASWFLRPSDRKF
ncbi:DoxX family protein [Sphingobacterium alkalisoli]|uniref:DoxX family protein n=1 Tax=Sphingobacterium alkalisoli TaxID=1874115 RepID=A0A4U0H9G9_9SPHI|nr:DoxX family protein [Sphingobacterium alkalisoli]TJY68438.1 DoxX family protein [Sphingobacterium alkalisoli]GGH06487.1 membrane protein [Sphingobacterium alkalisoli]